MSGLFGSLSIALTSLSVSQQEMAVTGNNVANANTPGYSREIPAATAGDPIIISALSFGTGVLLQKIESLRDPILEIQLHQETQQQSKLNQLFEGLNEGVVGVVAELTQASHEGAGHSVASAGGVDHLGGACGQPAELTIAGDHSALRAKLQDDRAAAA